MSSKAWYFSKKEKKPWSEFLHFLLPTFLIPKRLKEKESYQRLEKKRKLTCEDDCTKFYADKMWGINKQDDSSHQIKALSLPNSTHKSYLKILSIKIHKKCDINSNIFHNLQRGCPLKLHYGCLKP